MKIKETRSGYSLTVEFNFDIENESDRFDQLIDLLEAHHVYYSQSIAPNWDAEKCPIWSILINFSRTVHTETSTVERRVDKEIEDDVREFIKSLVEQSKAAPQVYVNQLRFTAQTLSKFNEILDTLEDNIGDMPYMVKRVGTGWSMEDNTEFDVYEVQFVSKDDLLQTKLKFEKLTDIFDDAV